MIPKQHYISKHQNAESALNRAFSAICFCIIFGVYIDDGGSGTTWERSGFKAMIADVEDGKIGIVITKDLSRLGRDYLKTGELIEIIFPEFDVRYIAVNDGVDTAKNENELMAFKNIFNDWYARDCSKKIKAVFRAKGESEKHLCPPFMDTKNPTRIKICG